MQAISQLYRIGYGPSSSHTIAPYRIVSLYKQHFVDCKSYKIELGGSLALTAKGHGTIDIIKKSLSCENIEFIFNLDNPKNALNIQGFNDAEEYETWHALSLGGGAIEIKEFNCHDSDEIYKEKNFDEIKKYLKDNNCNLLDYVYHHEPLINDYLKECLRAMFNSISSGLEKQGLLNADLNYYRVASRLYQKAKERNDYLIAYSYAMCEENAAGSLVCTSPTLGACGIIASLMYYLHFNEGISEDKLCELLIVAGIFGNCIKYNASIAGSKGGCQAEVGTACAMACAAISYYNHQDLQTIEYAAEMGIEHFLGLTCDPVKGYVIIPCIERNAISILKAFDCAYLAGQLVNIKENAVSFDQVVKAMNYTGSKIAMELKETSLGGLSMEFKKK